MDYADLLEKARPMVRRHAETLARRLPYRLGLDADELAQVGMIAAWKTIPRWNPRASDFDTYVGRRVYGAMLDAVRVAGVLGFTCVGIRRRAKAGEHVWVAPLYAPVYGNFDKSNRYGNYDGGERLGDGLAGEDGRDAEYDAPADRVRDAVRGAGGWLGPGEADVLADYYVRGMTLKEIGRQRGVCESRVSQMVSGILGRIRTEAGEGDEAAGQRDGHRGRTGRVVNHVRPDQAPAEVGPEVRGR